jgi:hypothetical protein
MTKEEIITTKAMGVTSYLGLILGTITQDTTLMLSAISYMVGIVLGLITIYIKISDFCKKRKNENTANFKGN